MCETKLIEDLKKLTYFLPPLSSFTQSMGSRVVEYDVEAGFCVGFCLFNNNEVAVQRSFLSIGTEFPLHKHEHSMEMLMVYRGHLRVLMNDKIFELTPGDSLRIPENTMHSVSAQANTELIGVTIPADKGYPEDD